ncbi:MAG: glutamate--tRNA ligase, partial [Selenomonas sp.]|nr:glutamate--tRNA ligase [Selenomonas sp.]
TTNQEIFSMEELISHFGLDGLSKSPAVFDYDKLGWINGEYFKAMSDEEFAERAREFVGDLPDYLEKNWQMVAALLKTRVQRFSDVKEEIDFLITLPEFDADLYNNKRNKVNPEKAAELMPKLVELLEGVSEADWNNDSLYAKLEEYIAAQELKKGLVMWVLRIGVAGKSVTPGGATEILSILGKENSLARLQKSLANLTA